MGRGPRNWVDYLSNRRIYVPPAPVIPQILWPTSSSISTYVQVRTRSRSPGRRSLTVLVETSESECCSDSEEDSVPSPAKTEVKMLEAAQPEVETPKEESPKEEAPKEETPKEEAPKEEAPKEDTLKEVEQEAKEPEKPHTEVKEPGKPKKEIEKPEQTKPEVALKEKKVEKKVQFQIPKKPKSALKKIPPADSLPSPHIPFDECDECECLRHKDKSSTDDSESDQGENRLVFKRTKNDQHLRNNSQHINRDHKRQQNHGELEGDAINHNRKAEPRTNNSQSYQSNSRNNSLLPRNKSYQQEMDQRVLHAMRADVILREDVIEGPSDPRPNAFFDTKNGVLRVYHGNVYGNPFASILPPAHTPVGAFGPSIPMNPPPHGQFYNQQRTITNGHHFQNNFTDQPPPNFYQRSPYANQNIMPSNQHNYHQNYHPAQQPVNHLQQQSPNMPGGWIDDGDNNRDSGWDNNQGNNDNSGPTQNHNNQSSNNNQPSGSGWGNNTQSSKTNNQKQSGSNGGNNKNNNNKFGGNNSNKQSNSGSVRGNGSRSVDGGKNTQPKNDSNGQSGNSGANQDSGWGGGNQNQAANDNSNNQNSSWGNDNNQNEQNGNSSWGNDEPNQDSNNQDSGWGNDGQDGNDNANNETSGWGNDDNNDQNNADDQPNETSGGWGDSGAQNNNDNSGSGDWGCSGEQQENNNTGGWGDSANQQDNNGPGGGDWGNSGNQNSNDNSGSGGWGNSGNQQGNNNSGCCDWGNSGNQNQNASNNKSNNDNSNWDSKSNNNKESGKTFNCSQGSNNNAKKASNEPKKTFNDPGSNFDQNNTGGNNHGWGEPANIGWGAQFAAQSTKGPGWNDRKENQQRSSSVSGNNRKCDNTNRNVSGRSGSRHGSQWGGGDGANSNHENQGADIRECHEPTSAELLDSFQEGIHGAMTYMQEARTNTGAGGYGDDWRHAARTHGNKGPTAASLAGSWVSHRSSHHGGQRKSGW